MDSGSHMGEFDHITDRDVRILYEQMRAEPYDTLDRGEQLIGCGSHDAIAILYAMREAVRAILDDLAEHADANRMSYGGHDTEHFVGIENELEERIDKAYAKGLTSDVFDRYHQAHDGKMDAAAEQFLSGDATAQANNELLACVDRDDKSSACSALAGVVAAWPSHTSSPCAFELLGNALVIAQRYGDRILQDRVLALADPGRIADQRLLFNVACLRAVRGEKVEMLAAIGRAIELGRPKETFMDDPDFEVYQDDPEFTALVGEAEPE